MKYLYIKIIIGCLSLMVSNVSLGQGPPITADKPIMLGAKRKIVKTLTEHRVTKAGQFTNVPVMLHYLPTANILTAVHIPYVSYQLNNESSRQATLGDIQLLGKYQFFRKDEIGKTFRLVAKTLQTLPTGSGLGIDGIATGQYQSYAGLVAGYETIKYGISNELGMNIHPSGNDDEMRYKLGFGLPLLKPTYPVKQINLYFEYNSQWFFARDAYQLLYAQGIQYAIKQLTLEMAIQVPMVQHVDQENTYQYSLFMGTRYVF